MARHETNNKLQERIDDIEKDRTRLLSIIEALKQELDLSRREKQLLESENKQVKAQQEKVYEQYRKMRDKHYRAQMSLNKNYICDGSAWPEPSSGAPVVDNADLPADLGMEFGLGMGSGLGSGLGAGLDEIDLPEHSFEADPFNLPDPRERL